MNYRLKDLHEVSKRDRESIYRYAMARSKEIVDGLPEGSETIKIGKGKKMSLFEQMANARVQGGGAKIREPEIEGATQEFQVRLDRVSLQQSNQGLKTLFIVEFTILKGTEKNPEGAQRSWVQFPEHRPQTDPGNCKAFAAAVLGLQGEDPEVPASAFDDLIGGKYDGAVLDLTVMKKLTKSKHDFWVHTWRPAAQAPAPVPDLPSAPALTKESWLAGEGDGTEHPQNPAYEHHPDHPEWGVREAK